MIARAGQNLAANQYRRYRGFPGLVEGQRLVARDEARHIGIGVSYLRERMSLSPEHTRRLIDEVLEDLLAVAAAMLETAKSRIDELVRSGYGTDADGFYAEVMRLVTVRLASVGYLEE